jgi:hypothetical protein
MAGCAASGTGRAGYADAFGMIDKRFLESVGKFDQLVAQSEGDPSARQDVGWRGELLACFAIWGETADELRAQEVPEQYRDAHLHWLTGADHYTRAGELMRASFDNPTPELAAEIEAELTLGNEYFDMARAAMEEIGSP